MQGGYHEHLSTFVIIAKSGSLTRASVATGADQSTLSRRLAALEKHLGCRLFHRSTRSIRLTEKGEIFLPHAERTLQAAADAMHLLREGKAAFSGRLRVACSIAVARRLLIPALPRWQSLHPALSLDLAISDQVARIVEDQIDVALRAGPLTDSSLIARPVGVSRRIVVASADYLRRRGTPAEPDDLKGHDCIVFSGALQPQQWDFTNARGSVSVRLKSRLSVSTVDALYDAVRAGLGFAVLPTWFCSNELRDGLFVQALPDHQLPSQTLYAVTLSKPPAGGKVQAFAQFAQRLLSVGARDGLRQCADRR